ncbi:MAG: hypothetical protein WCW26_02175 [Candidatus Buchananbacteria bacterium]
MFNQHYNPILFDSYWRDRIIKTNLIFSIVANFILWLGLIWQFKNFSESVPLHYNIYYGIDLIGPWYQILVMPGLGLLFILINLLASAIIYRKEKMIGYFLVGACSLCQLIFVLASIFITFINY